MACGSNKHRTIICSLICAWLCLNIALSAAEPPNVLDLPRILQQQAEDNKTGSELLQAGEAARAKVVLIQCVMRVPHDPIARYNLACAYAMLGESADAIENLRAAIKAGFRSREQMAKDDDLKVLRELPEFGQLLTECDQPLPKAAIGWKYSLKIPESRNGTVTVDSECMVVDAKNKFMKVFVKLDEAAKDRLACGLNGTVGDALLKWFLDGSAAGNVGDLYDNHDKAHSQLDLKMFPQLTAIQHGPEIQKRHLDNGVQKMFLYMGTRLSTDKARDAQVDRVAPAKGALRQSRIGAADVALESESATIVDANALDASSQAAGQMPTVAKDMLEKIVVLGNSSTALTGSPFWRSMPRLALTSPGGAEVLVQHYMNNHLYVYPEHRDHDAGHDEANGWGDVFFANTPYYVISQGSSGTDQVFLQALAATLAAFPPESKNKLRQAGLIAPTLQMLLRRNNRLVQSDQDYLSGVAHPTVFEGNHIDMERMVSMAHALKPAELPPIAVLKVIREELGDPTVDYFDSMPIENVLTSPFAIGRTCASTKYWREMEVSPAASIDVNGARLTFEWVVLRGDPERIQIDPVTGDSQARRIRVGYHSRFPIQRGSSMESSRVDIGVFAHNGHYYSAPSIISFYFPDNEVRVYDDQQRILSVDYRSASDNYVDPTLIAERNWRDDYHYDAVGKLAGWTRTRGERREEFNATGQLLQKADANGPALPVDVVYERLKYPDGRPFIRQVALTRQEN